MYRFLLFLMFPFLFSFNFSPMSQSIDLGQNRKGAQFLIENDTASNIAVELTVKERQMDENGVEKLLDTKAVTIFPPLIIVPPKEKRTIRVSYNEKDVIKKEQNFRVIAEQLALNVDEKKKDKAGIKLLMKYVAALYATPPEAKSDLKLISHKSDGKILTLVVENKGNKHQLLTNPVISFLQNGKKGELKTDELKGFAGENVLAGQKRVFKIKSTVDLKDKARVELKVND